MKLELFLISAYEEYTNKHMCRDHWNYQWRGRRGTFLDDNKLIKLRKENFGGLLQAVDGKIYKLDDYGYDFVKQYRTGNPLCDICKNLSITKEEGLKFVEKLNEIGV